ncbi:MAG: peptide ABC transporter substrate-binding protein, partial [Nevskiales bacterium]
MWKSELGLKVTLTNEEWKVFLQNVDTKKVTQVYRGGWIGDYNDAFTFAELMHSRFGLNGTGYANPDYDARVDAASVEVDLEKRRELLQSAERQLLADQPLIPVYFYVSKRVVKPYVRGYQGNIMNHHASKDLWIETRKP